MKNISRENGFTLLELLVVVIIIAVLAAVAWPQYKHAVLKSRFSKVMPVAKAVADAQEVYYLGKSYYADDTEKDVLDISAVTDTTVDLTPQSQEEEYSYVAASRTDVPGVRYIMYQQHSPKFAGTIQCEADETNADALWLCEKGLSGTEIPGSINTTGGAYRTFLLSGDTGGATLPTSIARLKAQICGTQFDEEHCLVDETNQTITTLECSNTLSYNAEGTSRTGRGCSSTVYDKDGNLLKHENTICATNASITAQGDCEPSASGTYQYTYATDGSLLSKNNCETWYSSSGKCSKVTLDTYNPDRTYYQKIRQCSKSGESPDLQTGACANGYSNSYDQIMDTHNNRIYSYGDCSIDQTTGECLRSTDQMRTVRTYDKNGRENYQHFQCLATAGLECTGGWKETGTKIQLYSGTSYRGYRQIGGNICLPVGGDYNCSSWYAYTYNSSGTQTGKVKCTSYDTIDWENATCS